MVDLRVQHVLQGRRQWQQQQQQLAVAAWGCSRISTPAASNLQRQQHQQQHLQLSCQQTQRVLLLLVLLVPSLSVAVLTCRRIPSPQQQQ
jgi:hypothetical protein